MGTLSAVKSCRCCVVGPKGEKVSHKKKLLTRAIESFYDNCAAYNLRYIPYRTMTDETSLHTIVKDLVLLFCFFVTNFVVFLTILSRIAMHLCDLGLEAFEWAKEMIRSQHRARQKMLTHLRQEQAPAPQDYPNFCRNRPH